MKKIYSLLVVPLTIMCSCSWVGDMQKSSIAEELATEACEDLKNQITQYANQVIPIIGQLLVNQVITDNVKQSVLCDCIHEPVVEGLIAKYSASELNSMKDSEASRTEALNSILIDKSAAVFDCYKEKGGSSIKYLQQFFNSALEKFANE